MTNQLGGKAALVVGGTRGIGAAISRRFVSDGASVVMLYKSRTQEALSLSDELSTNNAKVAALKVDISDAAAFSSALENAISIWSDPREVIHPH